MQPSGWGTHIFGGSDSNVKSFISLLIAKHMQMKQIFESFDQSIFATDPKLEAKMKEVLNI